MYFIDVEGGQSTLIVTPAGESLLVDTGYDGFDGRDAKRILAAARDAGVRQIDYLLMTHFHQDHDGGIVELSRQMPIRTFFDHGDLVRESGGAGGVAVGADARGLRRLCVSAREREARRAETRETSCRSRAWMRSG